MGITGLILAGGQGARMGYADKGLQLLSGMPMIQHVFDRLRPQVETIIISANRNLDLYQRLGAPVRQDTTPDFAGPLAGLQTGLQHCSTPLLASVPCDAPFLPGDLVDRMQTALLASGADIAVAVSGTGEQQRAHPVFSLLKVTLLPHLSAFMRDGGRKVSAWQACHNIVEVQFDDDFAFRNINSPEDLQQFTATSL